MPVDELFEGHHRALPKYIHMGNIFGKVFQTATWGESHGKGIGAVIDGVPAGLELSVEDIQKDLDRRISTSSLTTSRRETDKVEIYSGVFEGKTLGTPIMLFVPNMQHNSKDYAAFADIFRPSHGDFSWLCKYKCRDWRGGGRASARETAARVAAGAVARKMLTTYTNIEVLAWVSQVYNISTTMDPKTVTAPMIQKSPVNCPDPKISEKIAEFVEQIGKKGDSCGGIIQCAVRNVPKGLGEPVFDKLQAVLAHALLSIPAVKAVEFGLGFKSCEMLGSEHNDAFVIDHSKDGKQSLETVRTKTNNSAGIQGGITNGEDIYCRIAVKPTPSIALEQDTVDINGQERKISVLGRNDPCAALRAPAIAEAMILLALADAYLLQRLQTL